MADKLKINFTMDRTVDKELLRSLMVDHITQIFNEFDEEIRGERMKQMYHEDLSWSQPEEHSHSQSILQGRAKINSVITEEQKALPGHLIRIVDNWEEGGQGFMAVSHNLGIVHWAIRKDGGADVVKAAHVVLVEEKKIKAFWTMHLQTPGGSSRV